MRHARLVVAELRGVAPRIVDAKLLDVRAVARAARLGSHDPIEWGLLGSLARETNLSES